MFRDVEIPERRSGPKPPPLRYSWDRVKVGPPYPSPIVYLSRIDDQTILQVMRAGNAYWSWLVIHLREGQPLTGGYGYAPTMGWAKHRAEMKLDSVRPQPQTTIWSNPHGESDDGKAPF